MPDERTLEFPASPDTVYFNLTGLSQASKYNVTLFASSTYTGAGANGSTIYTINGVAKSLYAANNTQNTVTFSSVSPNASVNINVKMSKDVNTPYGMVNTIVLEGHSMTEQLQFFQQTL